MPYAEHMPLGRDGLAGLAPSSLEPVSVIWLLTLEWAGRTWRWSTTPIDVLDRAGDSYPFAGGLPEVDVQRALGTLADTPDLLSVSFDLLFGADVAELVEAGHDLAAASGELAMLLPGQLWETRAVVCAGRVSQPEYGYEGEPVAFSLIEEPYDDRASYPPAGWRVSEDTWPDAPDASMGRVYPVVFGSPGVFRKAGSEYNCAGSPAIIVAMTGAKADTLLIAGHSVVATTVTVYCDADPSAAQSVSVTVTTDSAGQVVATVDISTQSDAFRETGTYWIAWTGGGALPDPWRADAALTGAGSLLSWWLDRSTLRVDRGRFEALRALLDSYVLGGYVDEVVVPWQWCEDNLLPLLPVTIHSGPSGLFPVLWRYEATARDAVARIDADTGGCSLEGRVSYERKPSELRSEVRVRWAKDVAGEYRRTTVESATYDPEDAGSGSSYHAVVSSQRYSSAAEGVEEIESDLIWSEATAARVAHGVLADVGFAPRVATYDCPPELVWLDLGDVVVVDDSRLAWGDKPGLIVGWAASLARVVLTVQVLENPADSPRSTGPDPDGRDYDPWRPVYDPQPS